MAAAVTAIATTTLRKPSSQLAIRSKDGRSPNSGWFLVCVSSGMLAPALHAGLDPMVA
jgi:hypothetical protein